MADVVVILCIYLAPERLKLYTIIYTTYANRQAGAGSGQHSLGSQMVVEREIAREGKNAKEAKWIRDKRQGWLVSVFNLLLAG